MPATAVSRASRLLFAILLGCLSVVACAVPDVQTFKPGSDGTEKKSSKKKTPTDDGAPPATEDPTTQTPPAPEAPTLTAVSPDSAGVGSAPGGIDITLSGSRFVAGAKVDIAGTSVDATLTSPTELKVKLTGAQLATARVLPIAVVSPTKGKSNALSFTVANPSSVTISTLSPAAALVNANNVKLTVVGSGYIQASVVQFNGTPLTTTFTSASQLTATLPATALQSAGRVSVTVSSGGGIVSLPSPFEVQNPAPQISNLSPNQVAANTAATITINGTGFTTSSEVISGQSPLQTTFISAQQLRASVNATLTANTFSIQVRTPAPGGGSSNTATVNVQQQQTTTCTYSCAQYGYAAGECSEGWACNGATGCLYQTTCGGNTGGGGNGSCLYSCKDYGYAPGQCSNGWYCLPDGQYAGCLGQTTC